MASTARWEWRAFGASLDAAERLFAGALGAPATTRETYLLRADSGLNVKIRRDQLEVKTLQHVVGGLEQWMPTLKAPFPLDASAVAALCAAWHTAPPSPSRPVYDVAAFLEAFVDGRDVSSVEVVKTRRTGTYDGCLVEIAQLVCDGTVPTSTIAVEGDDPASVRRVLLSLRLAPGDNVNYVRALGRYVAERGARARLGAKEAPRHDQRLSA
jgi:exopolyphosphatase/guanosine-5'-triphosphate,3'-diphosphate pyrophosphatase